MVNHVKQGIASCQVRVLVAHIRQDITGTTRTACSSPDGPCKRFFVARDGRIWQEVSSMDQIWQIDTGDCSDIARALDFMLQCGGDKEDRLTAKGAQNIQRLREIFQELSNRGMEVDEDAIYNYKIEQV